MVRGQASLEYLLILGGSVLLASVLVVFVRGNLGDVVPGMNESVDRINLLSSGVGLACSDCDAVFVNEGQPNSITQGMLADDVILNGSSTWTQAGADQYSSLSGNVGIGTQNPTSKLSVNGSVDVSNHTITGLAAPINDSDAANKAYVDASGGSGGNTTVIFNSTLEMRMPLQGVIDYSPIITSYVSTIPLSLPKANCGVKITACNSAPGSLIIGADPVPRIVVPNIHHTPLHEVQCSSYGWGSTSGSGPICGEMKWSGNCGAYESMTTKPVYCYDSSMYCVTEWSVFRVSIGGQSVCDTAAGACCPLGSAYDSGNGVCYTVPSGYSWDSTSKVCYTGANSAANRCPSAAAGETFLRWINTASSRTCVFYDSTAYADSTRKFIFEDGDSYIYCPTDHPTYDSTSGNCIRSNTVRTTATGDYCSTLNTYLPTAFTDVTFRNTADTAYVTSTYIRVAYNCP